MGIICEHGNIYVRNVSIFLLLLAANICYAYRPFGTEDAGVAGKGVVQLETSWEYLQWKNKDFEHVLQLVPIVGITERIELSSEIPFLMHYPYGQNVHHYGVGDINIVGKYLAMQEDGKLPAITFKGVFKLNTGDFDNGLGSGDKDYSAFLVFSKSFAKLAIHSNFGYSIIGNAKNQNLRNIYSLGLAFDYKITRKLNIVWEINETRHPDRGESSQLVNVLAGIIYTISDKIAMDVALKKGLSSVSPSYGITIGYTISF